MECNIRMSNSGRAQHKTQQRQQVQFVKCTQSCADSLSDSKYGDKIIAFMLSREFLQKALVHACKCQEADSQHVTYAVNAMVQACIAIEMR